MCFQYRYFVNVLLRYSLDYCLHHVVANLCVVSFVCWLISNPFFESDRRKATKQWFAVVVFHVNTWPISSIGWCIAGLISS